MFDILIFTLDDVREIRKDTSLNIDDFEQYAREAQRNYLRKILGAKLYTALVNNQSDARFVDLINGKIYDDGYEVIFDGLKVYVSYVWLYLYSLGSSSSLTPIGARIFKDEYAIEAANRKESQNNSDHFLKSAEGLEDGILRFLRKNRSVYPEFTESRQIKQASKDNVTFKTVGRRVVPPNNYVM